MDKATKTQEAAAYWGAFYRENPHRFVAEFLNIQLKTFQKILIFLMMHMTNVLLVASRGIGKTWLLALYCIVRCILYPGTKICIASGTKGQAIEVLEKIEKEFLVNYTWGSTFLKREIENINTGVNKAECVFTNGSWIKVVTSTDNARHNRANVVIIDEYRMVAKDIIDTVLRKFKSAPRQPGYLKKPEYAHLAERNCEIYASSAYYKAHWAYGKMRSYFANMLDEKRRYMCFGFPYQLAIMEGLLLPEEVEDEMSEEDFDEIAWLMEMCALWYGASGEAFFDYEDLTAQRKIKNAFLPLFMYEKRGINVPDLLPNERRILSVDVALMATKKHKNDAASLSVNVALPTETNYQSNFVYMETKEGLTTDELGLLIMKMFYGYKCTDLVLDTSGNGLGVFDYIIKEHYDPETGQTYEALTSCNNSAMADRCKVRTAKKCVWCIKADAGFNSNSATLFRSGIKSGNINLLVNEMDAEPVVKKTTGYKSLEQTEQNMLLLPYFQTTMLINEMINLEHEISGNKIKLTERSGMRKDRWSSVEYSYAITQELSKEMRPNKELNGLDKLIFHIRAPKKVSQF